MNPGARRSLGSRGGSALLAALCFAAVLAIALGSYITVCYRTLQMSSRSMQATQSLELAEIGMEEILWALNNDDWSAWSITGSTATKALTGFAYANDITGRVDLTIANYNGSTGTRTLTVTGTTAAATGNTIRRTLTATSAKAPLFVNAIAATSGRVKFKSAGTADSYDSSLGDYAAQTPSYSAIISAGSTSTSSATVQLTNAQIKGYVATLSTGPSYGSSAKVIGPTTPGTLRIDSAQLSTSPYQPAFDELATTGTSTLLPAGTATIGTAGAASAEVYHATDLTLNGNQTLTVNGPVVINLSGSLNISNSAKIHIASTGAVEIHLAGDLTINGNGIQNDTKLPKNLAIIGTAAENDSLSMATNTPFHGVIYTPLASLTVGNSQAIYGSIVAKAVTFNASPAIHYDLSLRQAVFSGIETPYAISDWRETSDGG